MATSHIQNCLYSFQQPHNTEDFPPGYTWAIQSPEGSWSKDNRIADKNLKTRD
jgi:hypothetical protein